MYARFRVHCIRALLVIWFFPFSDYTLNRSRNAPKDIPI